MGRQIPLSVSYFLQKTLADRYSAWPKYVIGQFNSPVAVVAVDITQNGLMDLVICHDYGPFMLDCDPKGGFVTWLENPGREGLMKNEHWKERYIGRWPAMHRMKAGYFTQKTFLEVIAASVVYGRHDKTTPIPIIRFQAPEKVLEATEWDRDIIDDQNFTVIHEVTVKKFDGPKGLDSMIISSREGTTRLFYADNIWKRELIGIGEPRAPGQSATSESPGSGDHWGSGCADVGKVAGDPFAYIATLDPFHGTSACVYTKVDRGIGGNKWKRHVLDVYGTPNQLKKTGDGPGHYIVCADFDGDGDDEFLLALFGSLNRDEEGNTIPNNGGPEPNKGIMYYKALDLERGLFAKWKVADESSARIAIGNFAGTGKIDFVSMSYNVKLYYEEPKPMVTIHTNDFAPVNSVEIQSLITPTVWADEGMVYLPRPKKDQACSIFPLIEVANYSIAVEVHAPNQTITVEEGQGFKPLFGSLHDKSGIRTALGTSPFPTTVAIWSDDLTMSTGEQGAIFLRLTPLPGPKTWSKSEDVPVKTTFSTGSYGLNLPSLKFKKVEELWWGQDFKGKDFYNLSGFHFRFLDDKTPIAHMQFWTAGTNVNCGVHNHSLNNFQEIHIGLSPGTLDGGMSRLKDSYSQTPEDQLSSLGPKAFEHVPIQRLHEHGGIWYRDSYGNPQKGKDGVVAYPWHKWQAGCGADVDVWLALEFSPASELPLQ
ncbi:hypothetical protein BGZ60DRAFT_391028 [Tricladium varicosporioides]|nr:hypothetical protein BGZ60DRAFT_391028 [Hymenoscyphus varicosporioides]